MPTCPTCRSRHDTWGGVAVHIWKKSDADHDMADSKDDALIWLAENGHITADVSPDMSSEPVGTSTDGGQSDPEPVEFPDNPDHDADDGGQDLEDDDGESSGPPFEHQKEPTCPGCGSHNIADADAVVRNQEDVLTGEYVQLLRTSDFVCAECGGVFDE